MRGFGLIRQNRLVFGRVHGRDIDHPVVVGTALIVVSSALFTALDGKTVRADNHILRRGHDRFAVGKFQNIIGGKHQKSRFRLRFDAQRKVHGHLVAVEVRVERSADERGDLNGSAFDQNGLERLNGKPVQRGSAV